MDLQTIELWIRWAGAGTIVALTIMVLIGFWQGRCREQGRASGTGLRFLRLPMWAYLALSLVYSVVCYLLWKPLPLFLSPATRLIVLVIGCLLYFLSLGLILWARHTLGEMLYISLCTGAQLYAGHRLITQGPFAIIRHPMYAGTMLGFIGALLIYRTWTIVFLLVHCLVFVIRADREEEALSVEFGDKWTDYCKRVPGWFPRLGGR